MSLRCRELSRRSVMCDLKFHRTSPVYFDSSLKFTHHSPFSEVGCSVCIRDKWVTSRMFCASSLSWWVGGIKQRKSRARDPVPPRVTPLNWVSGHVTRTFDQSRRYKWTSVYYERCSWALEISQSSRRLFYWLCYSYGRLVLFFVVYNYHILVMNVHLLATSSK